MSDTCPLCGAAMADDTPAVAGAPVFSYSCAKCAYWIELVAQPDGTIVAVGHEAEEGER